MKKPFLLLNICLIFTCGFLIMGFSRPGQQKKKAPFTYDVYRNLVNYFNSEKEVQNFFAFRKGDKVADIGAGKGEYEGALSLLFDSIDFYVQDIDAKLLNGKSLDKTVKKYNTFRDTPQSCRFTLCLGNERSTQLPGSDFDVIITISAIHEFSYMQEMLADISRKLKSGGRFIVLDAPCTKKGHRNYTAAEIVALVKPYGFSVLKQEEKDGTAGLYRLAFSKL